MRRYYFCTFLSLLPKIFYIFDYRLKNESPAIGAAYPDYTLPEAQYDRYGLPRGPKPDLGAYVYVPAEEETEVEN